MKQIDLKQILEVYKTTVNGNTVVTVDSALKAMQEACNQTIDLCAENAETDFDLLSYEEVRYYVDKQSILDTKEQIKL